MEFEANVSYIIFHAEIHSEEGNRYTCAYIYIYTCMDKYMYILTKKFSINFVWNLKFIYLFIYCIMALKKAKV